jgi:hypothetical protein
MTQKKDLTPRRAGHQLLLFPATLDEVIAQVLVSADEMRSWQCKGWLFFDASEVSQFDESELDEILFVKRLAHSGLSDAMINRLLSAGLDRPYCYDPSTTYHSFCQNRWTGLPSAPDPAEVTRDYIDELVRDEEWPALLELKDGINQALADAEVHRAAVKAQLQPYTDGMWGRYCNIWVCDSCREENESDEDEDDEEWFRDDGIADEEEVDEEED